jgi:hypothetical protein
MIVTTWDAVAAMVDNRMQNGTIPPRAAGAEAQGVYSA